MRRGGLTNTANASGGSAYGILDPPGADPNRRLPPPQPFPFTQIEPLRSKRDGDAVHPSRPRNPVGRLLNPRAIPHAGPHQTPRPNKIPKPNVVSLRKGISPLATPLTL